MAAESVDVVHASLPPGTQRDTRDKEQIGEAARSVHPILSSFLQRKRSALCQYRRWKVELHWRFSLHCSVHDNVAFSYHCATSALSHLRAVSCFTAFPLLWCLCVCFATWVWKTTCFLLVLPVLSLKGSNFKIVVPLFKFKIHFLLALWEFLTRVHPQLSTSVSPEIPPPKSCFQFF